MRHLISWLAEALPTVAVTAIATTVGVLMLTHPHVLQLPAHSVPLGIVAILSSFVVYSALESLINSLWPRDDAEPEAAES